MKHITILSLKDATMSCIDSSYQILNRVNDFLKYNGRPPFFKVEIVGIHSSLPLPACSTIAVVPSIGR